MSNSNLATKKTGSIDEGGYLYGLNKQGFNNHKCLLELIANSIDSGATKITFKRVSKLIYMIDDGKGIGYDQFDNMFAMQRANHTNDKSCGISGIGGKVALLRLSNGKCVNIYTSDGNTYLKANIPWDEMFKQKQYSDMITIEEMNMEEKKNFQEKVLNKTGTVIKFPYNDSLRNVIEENFKIPSENDKTIYYNLDDLASCVFGRFDTNLYYDDYQFPNQIKEMKKYNYFGGNEDDYYIGKSMETITHYQHKENGENRYLWYHEGDNLEIVRRANGYSREPKKISTNLNDYEEIGEFKVTVGQRKDENVFDIQNPIKKELLIKRYNLASAELHNKYDINNLPSYSNYGFLHENNWRWLSKISFIRNKQLIGKFECPDIKPSSARGSAEIYHQYFAVRAELSYNPVCTHENKQDEAMNIQQNKNQWQPADMDINLTRLVKAIKVKKAKEVWEYWNTIIKEKYPEPVVEPTPEPVVEPVVEPAPEPVVEPTFNSNETASNSDETSSVDTHGADDNSPEVSPNPTSNTIFIRPKVDVHGHRKGHVTGEELINEIERVKNMINKDERYSDKYVNLFNTLCGILQ